MPAFSTSCGSLIERWQQLVKPQGSCELDVASEFNVLTGDVIARTAFGSSYQEGKKIFELQKEQVILVHESLNSIYIPGFGCNIYKYICRTFIRFVYSLKLKTIGSEGESRSKYHSINWGLFKVQIRKVSELTNTFDASEVSLLSNEGQVFVLPIIMETLIYFSLSSSVLFLCIILFSSDFSLLIRFVVSSSPRS